MPISLSSPRPPPQGPAPQDPPPPRQRNSRVSEGNVNDQHQDFQRQLALVQEEKAEDHKRRSQRACQHRLLVRLLVLLLLLLLCFVLGVLPQHYFPMDVSTEIFPTRAFQMLVLDNACTQRSPSCAQMTTTNPIMKGLLTASTKVSSDNMCYLKIL